MDKRFESLMSGDIEEIRKAQYDIIVNIGTNALPFIETRMRLTVNSREKRLLWNLVFQIDSDRYVELILGECRKAEPDFIVIYKSLDIETLKKASKRKRVALVNEFERVRDDVQDARTKKVIDDLVNGINGVGL